MSANWTIPDLREDYESLMNRLDAIKVTITEVESALPFMRNCYAYQSTLLEVLTWVQEMIMILEAEYFVENEEEIHEEIRKHQVVIFDSFH